MKCPICETGNTEQISGNLYRCNQCGHKFIGEDEETSTERAERHEEEYERRENSEGDGLMTMDDDDILPPDEF
jgi:ribosomal protein L37AE/L43A